MEEKSIFVRWFALPFLYKIQLWSHLLAGICGAISYGIVTKMIYSSVNVDLLTERLILSSVIGIVLSILWLTIQEKLFSWFIVLTIIECICYSIICIYTAFSGDYDSYLIWSTIIGGTIGHIVGGAGSKLHQKITDNEQYRTDYGYFIEIIACGGILIGGCIALLFSISPGVGFIIQLVSLVGFELSDVYIYKKVTSVGYVKKE